MCLFPRKNKYTESKAYKKGVKIFSCGCCPECLSKKARIWVLRAVMESRVNIGMMITLTYDSYKIIQTLEENPVDTSITVSKKHLQNFFKRLRARFPDKKIKYIAAAEYGKKTHRAHYHAIVFGLQFNDLVFLKQSKRGNAIFSSKTLTETWSHGICTVDCTNIGPAVARYCTKYAAKDCGIDDTFMLFSHGIGEEELRRRFTGNPYVIDGQQYAIPRTVWQWYISDKYKIAPPKYLNRPKVDDYYNFSGELFFDFAYQIARKRYFRARNHRQDYANLRDYDPVYSRYIRLQRRKSEQNERYKKTEFERILSLDNSKYWSYKQKALQAVLCCEQAKKTPPRAETLAYVRDREREKGLKGGAYTFTERAKMDLPSISRHMTANDSFTRPYITQDGVFIYFLPRSDLKNPFYKPPELQIISR